MKKKCFSCGSLLIASSLLLVSLYGCGQNTPGDEQAKPASQFALDPANLKILSGNVALGSSDSMNEFRVEKNSAQMILKDFPFRLDHSSQISIPQKSISKDVNCTGTHSEIEFKLEVYQGDRLVDEGSLLAGKSVQVTENVDSKIRLKIDNPGGCTVDFSAQFSIRENPVSINPPQEKNNPNGKKLVENNQAGDESTDSSTPSAQKFPSPGQLVFLNEIRGYLHGSVNGIIKKMVIDATSRIVKFTDCGIGNITDIQEVSPAKAGYIYEHKGKLIVDVTSTKNNGKCPTLGNHTYEFSRMNISGKYFLNFAESGSSKLDRYDYDYNGIVYGPY